MRPCSSTCESRSRTPVSRPGVGDLAEAERVRVEVRRLRGVADPELDVVDAVQRHEVVAVRSAGATTGWVLTGRPLSVEIVHFMIALSDARSSAIRCVSVRQSPRYGRHRPADRCAAAAERAALVPGIGLRVSLCAPAVKRRVDRLEADGRDPRLHGARRPRRRFGWATHAFVALYCEGRMAAAEVREAVERHPEVAAAYTVAGEASAILHVRARDTAHLEEALERIRDHPGVTPHADADRALDAVRAADGMKGAGAAVTRRSARAGSRPEHLCPQHPHEVDADGVDDHRLRRRGAAPTGPPRTCSRSSSRRARSSRHDHGLREADRGGPAGSGTSRRSGRSHRLDTSPICRTTTM